MHRREFLGQSALGTFLLARPWGSGLRARGLQMEQGAPTPEPVLEPHFPDRLHTFVWRNWELANLDRIATVLGTTPERVSALGASMGLPAKPHLAEDQLRRLYITVIRQNWHVLPHDQLRELLGWDSQHYEYTLKEDDFLWIKLGLLKPRCERLRYEEPSAAAQRRAAEIKRQMRATFESTLDDPGEPAFQFVADLSSTRIPAMRNPASLPAENEVDLSRGWNLRQPGEGAKILSRLLEEFRSYMRSAFGCEMDWAPGKVSNSQMVEVSVDAAMGQGAGSFQVSVEREQIRVIGQDVTGLQQGLYSLRGQMEERQGPYLAMGSVRRVTQMDPRYVYSYFALYGDRLPQAISDQLEGLRKRLG